MELKENGNYRISKEHRATAARNGITADQLRGRINTGWELERAVTLPPRPPRVTSDHWRSVAEENGISYDLFWTRMKKLGWSEERAATTTKEVAHKEKAAKSAKFITLEEAEVAKQNGILRMTVRHRIKAGWTREDALTLPVIPHGQRKRRGKQLQKKGCGTKPKCKGCEHATVWT